MLTGKKYSGILFLFFLSLPGFVNAHDLVLQDSKVIKVSPCDRQVRLTVRLDAVGHQHLAGKTGAPGYQIAVFSQNRKKKIMDLSVDEHDQGDTLFFVIPSQKLACDTSIKLMVDANNTVKETSEDNNSVTLRLVRPRSSGLIETCPVDPADCS